MKRLLILLSIGLIILCGFWFFLRAKIVNNVNTSIINMQAQNYEIEHDGLKVKGFPFKIDAQSKKISITAPKSNEPELGKNWSIKTGEIYLGSATLTPLSWDLTHCGNMQVDIRTQSNERYFFDITPATMDIKVTVGIMGKIKTAYFNMEPSHITSLLSDSFPVQSFEDLKAHLNVKGTSGILDVKVKNVVVSDDVIAQAKLVLGNVLSRVETTLAVKNWLVLKEKGSIEWMNSGGGIKSEHWLIKWGAVDIVGDFDIDYKEQKPEGIIHMRIKNVTSLIDKIASAGWIDSAMARKASIVISALDTDDEGRKSIKLRLKNGKLKYGFITLGKF
ncbi:MAG: DUF2125 domain-containing protein [Robiginitomaculum sp.]